MRLGSVAEWSIAPVLKTGNLKGFVSSNLTASAKSPMGDDKIIALPFSETTFWFTTSPAELTNINTRSLMTCNRVTTPRLSAVMKFRLVPEIAFLIHLQSIIFEFNVGRHLVK